jgi:hypothetical protein
LTLGFASRPGQKPSLSRYRAGLKKRAEAAMPYARARRFYLTPPSVPLFLVSVVLAVLAVLVTYGHLTLFRTSYTFMVLLIGYVVLAVGCLFRRV